MTGEIISSSSRAALLNGGGRGSDATSVTGIPASAGVWIGVLGSNITANPWFNTGGLAEVSIWGGAMSAAEMDSLSALLAAGDNPINLNAQAAQPWTGQLKAYWPLTSTSDLADASGNGHTLSMVGTLTNHASHPTIEAVSAGGQLMGQACL